MGDAVHVVPVNDLIDHDIGDPVSREGGSVGWRVHHSLEGSEADCPCGPRTEPVPREDGSVGWLVVHHSLDGRESSEGSS